MSECLVWSVSLASTEEQKKARTSDALLEKKTQNKQKKKQFILCQGKTGRNQKRKEQKNQMQ